MRYFAPLIVAIAVFLVACGDDGDAPTLSPSERDGAPVFVPLVTPEPFPQNTRFETWVFPADDSARTETSSKLSGDLGGDTPEKTSYFVRTVLAGGMRFNDTDNKPNPVEFAGCFGGSVVASLLLGCPGPLEDLTKTVEAGRYDGRSVTVLVTSGTSRGADEITTFTMRLYLDPATLLPIASETSGTFDYGEIEPLSARESYEHEWVARGSLPDDFFDPSSIGVAN